uniref:Thioredoxin domain-containing protein 9 n=1 Tax=Plectus sambesii TaxID=2011161 RepID=A0A914VYS7_9BILA
MAGRIEVGEQLGEQLMKAATIVEEQLDQELQRLETLDEDELERIRQNRIQMMKKKQQQKQDWMTNGHGEYSELADEREFFDACKKSTKLVCQFYLSSSERCKIVDKHLSALARTHLETRFVHINAEKVPFLTSRLNIRVIPTIAIVVDSKTVDYIRGFDDLGGTDEFTTEMLEWRLAQGGVIAYSGDLKKRPVAQKQPSKTVLGRPTKKNIRGKDADESSDDDW